ncbi:siderophore-interacting protein [Notoacmeibacter ruber]|uniref:Siderophore-interacting protein n=1 Tax=Notoacmeibacter ruber TaxID=2670375 RepID=A0A3L7JET1_9HYPH|nr:siderophore-interacting protein [Notoacmeibacter ruber]RLQ89173.1 siderophore-interacting protein [Notoacmeibacter ruber]
MTTGWNFRIAGMAKLADAPTVLNEIEEHFVEHAEVRRVGDELRLRSPTGQADISLKEEGLLIQLACRSEEDMQLSLNSIAEHLFYFAGDNIPELTWFEPLPDALPNFHHVTVVNTEDVTPHMRRVKFSCDDVSPFLGGGMHVRILVPPAGRPPVWPSLGKDGRIAWPKGDDELLVRIYTIRYVDVERSELWIDFLQHPAPHIATPGADFARDARAGDRIGLLGPGGGSVPEAETIFLAGDESALPAIARIAAEVSSGTQMQAIIEVQDASEEQALSTEGSLDLRWLHRESYPSGAKDVLATESKTLLAAVNEDTFVWVACEKQELRIIRAFLKERGHDRKRTYAAWYWDRQSI